MPEAILRLTPLQRRLLRIVVRDAPLARGDLARRADSSRSRVSPEIAKMIADGVLVEHGLGASTGGRRGALLGPGGRDVAVLGGVDIDAHRTAVAVTTLDGTVIARDEAAFPAGRDPARVLDRAAAMLERCLPADRGPLLAVGLSVPADINPATGTVESALTLPRWVGVSIAQLFAERIGVRAFVDNDVNVLALAEATRHDSAHLGSHILVVKISSGVGCGIAVDGTVFRGSRGFSGEIGHIAADPADPTPCACGNLGCLEAVASAPAILRAAAALHADEPLADVDSAGAPLTVEDVGRAARAGDPRVALLLRNVGSRLGYVLAGVVSFFNPSAVIVHSGMPGGEELLLNAIRQRVYERALPTSTRDLRFLHSRSEPGVDARGAGILARQGFLGAGEAVAQALPSRH
jgi:predicted NBD/HSP70 family sugar kinase